LKNFKHIVAACLLVIFVGTIVVCSVATSLKISSISLCEEENSGEEDDSFEYESILIHRETEIYFVEKSASKVTIFETVFDTACAFTGAVFSPPDLK
jgi:hypothetical protein